MRHIILILGAPNDQDGNLGQTAKDRLDCAFDIYHANENSLILCTGGFGSHFNTSANPHAYYAKNYLISKGVAKEAFLESPLSSNTVDDFRMTKSIILKINPTILFVITSDFHIKRAKILHDIIISFPRIAFIPARSSLSEKELEKLVLHEKIAIQELENNNYVLY